jgi:uncharacterized protein
MELDDVIHDIITQYRTIAVYGMSKNPEKAAFRVPAYLSSKGYSIIPVNPSADRILEQKCFPDLSGIQEKIDILEVFRPSDQALEVVKEAISRRKTKGDIAVIWLQEGIRNEEARKLAEEHGVTFIQDRCMYKEYQRCFPENE